MKSRLSSIRRALVSLIAVVPSRLAAQVYSLP
jgi:hypothetical protein